MLLCKGWRHTTFCILEIDYFLAVLLEPIPGRKTHAHNTPLDLKHRYGALMAHNGRNLIFSGPVNEAETVVLMLHGRGDSGRGILSLADVLGTGLDTGKVAFAAPEAEGHSWYPHSFLMPLERNEPQLSSALQAVGDALDELGIACEKVVLLGFSQGACLALEFAARNARRYGGVVALSGGLIGPEGTPRDLPGSLSGTPVFLGCSNVDAHIPETRVRESAEVMRKLGGAVDLRIYPGMGHTVNEDEIGAAKAIIAEAGMGARRG